MKKITSLLAQRLPAHHLPALSAIALVLQLSACAVGPDYVSPALPVPAQFKESAEESAAWKTAEPADAAPLGNWWQRFGDARLDALVAELAISNQNVLAAEAQFRQAAAALEANRAGLWPTLSASLGESRGRSATSGNNSGNNAANNPGTIGTIGTIGNVSQTDRLAFSVAWEADLWGRLRRAAEAGDANAQASAGDLRNALLSAQATLVQTYLQLRIGDAQRRLLQETVAAYDKALSLTRNRFESGIASQADVAQAETQFNTARVQLSELGVQRAQYEHGIALLLGRSPAEFKLEESVDLPELPQLPSALPTALLERRPDIAAAERRVAAANAQIGVSQAAFFPNLSLSASGGYQNNSFSQLLTAPHRFWSLGPTLALTLFDAGSRSAAKAQSEAAYDRNVALYRQAVLTAFQEVEDNLSSLRILGEEAHFQNLAAASAETSLRIAQNQYLAGTVSYLNVVTAQTATLGARRNRLDILGRRLLSSTSLLKALGGDWHLAGVPLARRHGDRPEG